MTTRSSDPLSFSSSSETVNKTRRKSRSDEKPALVIQDFSRSFFFYRSCLSHFARRTKRNRDHSQSMKTWIVLYLQIDQTVKMQGSHCILDGKTPSLHTGSPRGRNKLKNSASEESVALALLAEFFSQPSITASLPITHCTDSVGHCIFYAMECHGIK